MSKSCTQFNIIVIIITLTINFKKKIKLYQLKWSVSMCRCDINGHNWETTWPILILCFIRESSWWPNSSITQHVKFVLYKSIYKVWSKLNEQPSYRDVKWWCSVLVLWTQTSEPEGLFKMSYGCMQNELGTHVPRPLCTHTLLSTLWK